LNWSWVLPETEGVAIGLRLLIDFLGLAAAAATGRSFAASWSPVWLVAPAMIALSGAIQFLHYALFQETLLDPYYYGVTLLAMLIAAALGYRSKRALQMGTQYRWMFNTEGMFWSERREH
jgi:hypothetical protein